jgi:hypothetical protein
MVQPWPITLSGPAWIICPVRPTLPAKHLAAKQFIKGLFPLAINGSPDLVRRSAAGGVRAGLDFSAFVLAAGAQLLRPPENFVNIESHGR